MADIAGDLGRPAQPVEIALFCPVQIVGGTVEPISAMTSPARTLRSMLLLATSPPKGNVANDTALGMLSAGSHQVRNDCHATTGISASAASVAAGRTREPAFVAGEVSVQMPIPSGNSSVVSRTRAATPNTHPAAMMDALRPGLLRHRSQR